MQSKGLVHLILTLCSIIVAESTMTLEKHRNVSINNNKYQITNQSNNAEQCFLCTQGQVSDEIESRNLSHLFKGDVARQFFLGRCLFVPFTLFFFAN